MRPTWFAAEGLGHQGTDAMYRKWMAFGLLVMTSSVGCANRPGWGILGMGQGSVDRQRARAVYHDPYPLNDIGPEVVGGRPREFMRPMPEASRNQLFPSTFAFPGR